MPQYVRTFKAFPIRAEVVALEASDLHRRSFTTT